ncbi:uncharacterized protein J4E87_008015 [Alternaria ethzedia]|uniref:uncharacterized protein n=1 Tax=Alternaria ethzedia TaxID=181014 RepID=UPI0020C1CB78|nr:uncharacterized protein J4E87_008015 [Alternaria ethzedia]KAI4618006.1 hypothetical protein J4E87_008015 [Alternaria ethzedia]
MTLGTAQAPTDRKGSWLPFTFRWYSLLIPISATAILGITISLLIWYSQHHYGLGADDGSSAVLFGWRFTPTLLAVLYTQSTVILFEDAKRTEPFARLARAPSEGASAYGTLLQTPRAWWAILLDIVLKRKSVGKTSWCLICTAVINVVALLAISPLSSALLTSEEIVITKALDISRSVPRIGLQLPIVASRETYFRTTSALMRNLSTSAWIKDTSITFPNWPSTDTAQLGPDLVSSFNSWTAETTTIHANLGCRDMTLESADLVPMEYKEYDIMGHGPYKGVEPMVVFALASDDGCRHEITVHPAVNLAMRGGLTWSNTSTFYIEDELLPLGRMPFPSNVSSTSPYARHYASPECADRDIIILNTPWTKPVRLELSEAAGTGLELNRTYERSPDFRMKALLCKSQYSMETHNTSTSIGQGKEPNITSMESDHIQPVSITKDMIDIPKFEEMALQDTWKYYFNAESIATDADRALGGQLGPYSDPNMTTNAPEFFGLGPLLGALYSFNVTEMLNDREFVSRAERVKGRFFTECLREALNDPDVTRVEVTKGKATVVENRIMVLQEIGIALATLFLVSFLLLIMVFWVSRLSFRPLDLSMDPGSTLGHAIILQPYFAMSQRPTPITNGAGLTYRSKTWAGAAIKAARNKHWMLFLVATGSVLCQIRYWSPVNVEEFPNADSQWPVPFVTKWIVGKPVTVPGRDENQGPMLLFKDVPDLQAARCMPIVETSDAKVVVDVETGMVQSYEIISPVGPAKSAWSEVFVRHAPTHGNATQQYDKKYRGPLNVTTSYGVLFMGSMFKAADPNLGPEGTLFMESLRDNAFIMRDAETGMNMDLMTYSMYSLANKDPQALLDYATLVTHANHTFQTFFQHFISNGLSLEQGGWGYQKIGDNSTHALGEPVTLDGRVLPRRKFFI